MDFVQERSLIFTRWQNDSNVEWQPYLFFCGF